jgi:hypothetical protein
LGYAFVKLQGTPGMYPPRAKLSTDSPKRHRLDFSGNSSVFVNVTRHHETASAG